MLSGHKRRLAIKYSEEVFRELSKDLHPRRIKLNCL